MILPIYTTILLVSHKAIRCQSASLKDREEECKKVPTARKNNKCDPLFSVKRLPETREGLDIDKKCGINCRMICIPTFDAKWA